MEFRDVQRASEARIGQDGEHSSRASGSPREAAAVLCVICGTGIDTVAELALTDLGPAHRRCRPAAHTDPLP
jgi:hypothetical protein